MRISLKYIPDLLELHLNCILPPPPNAEEPSQRNLPVRLPVKNIGPPTFHNNVRPRCKMCIHKVIKAHKMHELQNISRWSTHNVHEVHHVRQNIQSLVNPPLYSACTKNSFAAVFALQGEESNMQQAGSVGCMDFRCTGNTALVIEGSDLKV